MAKSRWRQAGIGVVALALVSAPATAESPGAGAAQADATTPPAISSLRVSPKRFCSRRTRACPRPGARIRFTLSEGARVAGYIDPVGKPTGRLGDEVEFSGKRGANSFALSGRSLKRGGYRLTLTAEDPEGNESDAATTTFRLAHSRK